MWGNRTAARTRLENFRPQTFCSKKLQKSRKYAKIAPKSWKNTILRRKTSLQKAFCNHLPAQKGANIGLGNQNKQGKDKTNPKINKNKQPYVGNPACKKHSVTNCQPKGRCSNKLVEKNIKSVQIEWKLKVPHLPTRYSNSNYSNQVCAQLHNTWSNLFANL